MLFSYIIDPTYNSTNNANLNYAQLCSEILCIDINPVTQEGSTSMGNEGEDKVKSKGIKLMGKLHYSIFHSLNLVVPLFWTFLNSGTPLPSNVLTYFVKVNTMLLLKFPNDVRVFNI